MNQKFIDQFGSGFHAFNVPLAEKPKKYIISLLADEDPESLDQDKISNEHSLKVHFLERRDILITYCDETRYVVFTGYSEEFGRGMNVNQKCLICDNKGGFKINGTVAENSERDHYREEMIFCENCMDEFMDSIDRKDFIASVLSTQI